MSAPSVHPSPQPGDRRVRRTRTALIRALIELVGEKRYRGITIQDLLDRADVGRSTFYAHYRSKDDLLLRSFESVIEMLDQGLDDHSPRWAPVRELFQHVGEFRAFHGAMSRAHMLDRLFQAGTDRLSLAIECRLSRRVESGRSTPGVSPDFLARAFAGATFELLKWWLAEEAPYTPQQMDHLLHHTFGALRRPQGAALRPAISARS